MTDDADFQEYAEEHYFLADEEDNIDVDDDGDGYFSDGSLPREEMDEVDDDFFFGHILEDLSDDNGQNARRTAGDEVIPDDFDDTAAVGGGDDVSNGEELLNACDFAIPEDPYVAAPSDPTFVAQSTDNVAQKLDFELPVEEVNGDESTPRSGTTT